MLKKTLILDLLVVLVCGLAQATTVTVATFADPATNYTTPLFTVDLDNGIITGEWPDEPGLDLIIFGDSNNPFEDAFFKMTDPTGTTGVKYAGGIMGGETGGGIIKFFENGQDTSTTPLIQITFDSGHVTPFGFGATNLSFFGDNGDNVTIIDSEIAGSLAEEASFSFSFANHAPLSGGWSKGYTATASFTSSAVPEPATIALLGLGALSLLRRKCKA